MKDKTEPPPKRGNTSAASADLGDGLFVQGTVIGRNRTHFPGKDGRPDRWNIRLKLQTHEEILYVERWASVEKPADTPELGELVTLPVKMQVYTSSRGTSARLVWGTVERGEEF